MLVNKDTDQECAAVVAAESKILQDVSALHRGADAVALLVNSLELHTA